MLIHARRNAGIAVTGHRIGRHGDDREMRQAQFVPDDPGGRIAVEHRHLYIHQYDIKLRGRGRHSIHSELTIGCQRHDSARSGKQFIGNLLVDQVVFHHQNAHAAELSGVATSFGELTQTGVSGACIHQRVVQHGGGNRLDQKAVQHILLIFRAMCQHFPPVRRHHDDLGLWETVIVGQLPNVAGGFPSVHIRQLPVHVDDRIGKARGACRALSRNPLQRLRAGRSQFCGPTPGAHHTQR